MPKPFPTLPSRRHSLRLTQITPTKSSSLTTIHEATTVQQRLRRIGLHRRRNHLHPPHQGEWSKPLRQYLCDPVSLYHKPTTTWFTVWIWTRPAAAWALAVTSPPLHGTRIAGPISAFTPAARDDRESGWADNNPSSPFFGRMYVSWNDFAQSSGSFAPRYSTDNGTTGRPGKRHQHVHSQRPDYRRQGNGRRVHRAAWTRWAAV